MLIGDILLQLRDEIRARIRKGELTERALARQVGLSQPHVHHVLKGARLLTPEVADLFLCALGLSVPDLISTVQRPAGSADDMVGIRKGPGRETAPLRKISKLR